MKTTPWWQSAVFYQIYPRSFADGNGDGIGDLHGIIRRLDYLQALGIDAIWLSPHYPSPQLDVGYDISDYTAVEPAYGTLADFKHLLAEAKARRLRVVLDMVLNHTSDQHHWFQESRKSKDNPYRDWYIWHDAQPDGEPPNNWESIFGGSAWEYDETSGQYYYHYFLKEQPDLNWRNPSVQQAMLDAMRFWLEMGVDGFRLDAIGTIFEDPALTPHQSPYNGYEILKGFWLGREEQVSAEAWAAQAGQLFRYQQDLPEVFELMEKLRQLVDSYDDRYLIGEASDLQYVGNGHNRLHSVFNFDLLHGDRLEPRHIRTSQQKWLDSIPTGAWQSNTLNNHDQSRLWTHYANGDHDAQMARLGAALMLTLKGSPYLYYGEEIGMQDYAVQSFDEVRDMVSAVYRRMMLAEGRSDAQILHDLGTFSRDRCRTPMQWANTANAGFSPEGVKTWLPVHPNYQQGITVADQETDANSLLNFYRRLLAARKQNRALQYGDYEAWNEAAEVLAFRRFTADEAVLVAMNFSAERQPLAPLPKKVGSILFQSTPGMPALQEGSLAPFEVVIIALS